MSRHIQQEKVTVWTDGGSRGNPGPAAIGIILRWNGNERTYGEEIGTATNNMAEYIAVITALKKIKQLLGKARIRNLRVEIRLDSELVAKQIQGKYKILEKELQPLFLELWNLLQDFGSVMFRIVPREENRLADRLVNEVLDKKTHQHALFDNV